MFLHTRLLNKTRSACLHDLFNFIYFIYFPDKNDERIYFVSGNSHLGSTTYDGNDLKMNSIFFLSWFSDIGLDLSDDFVFISDYYYMYQLTKTSNNSDPITWFTGYEYGIMDIKLYEDTGKIHL